MIIDKIIDSLKDEEKVLLPIISSKENNTSVNRSLSTNYIEVIGNNNLKNKTLYRSFGRGWSNKNEN